MIATMDSKRAGQARMKKSQKTLAAILAAAKPAEGCGPEIPVAPGRGRIVAVAPFDGYRCSDGKWVWMPSGDCGHKAVRALDVFEDLNRKARRKGQIEPFTPAMMEAARHYRALVEKHSIGGVKCVSLEAQGGGGGGGGFIDAFLDVGRAITSAQNLIGGGAAIEVRRIRPSDRGDAGSRIVRDRDLADMVCLRDMSLSAVLEAHGCHASTRNLDALLAALRAILERLRVLILI